MLTLLGPQSRFGGESLGIRMVCPQIGTAVLEGYNFLSTSYFLDNWLENEGGGLVNLDFLFYDG